MDDAYVPAACNMHTSNNRNTVSVHTIDIDSALDLPRFARKTGVALGN